MEESLGRFLHTDEIVHHIDGNRKNNILSNLKIITQSEHVGIEHVGKRNPNGTMAASESIFEEIKFRLYDAGRGTTATYTLSKLIGTTFRRGKFQFRGRFTGLHDKNGKEIWESDIVVTCAVLDESKKFNCEVIFSNGSFIANGCLGVNCHLVEVIGNKFENPELLK